MYTVFVAIGVCANKLRNMSFQPDPMSALPYLFLAALTGDIAVALRCDSQLSDYFVGRLAPIHFAFIDYTNK